MSVRFASLANASMIRLGIKSGKKAAPTSSKIRRTRRVVRPPLSAVDSSEQAQSAKCWANGTFAFSVAGLEIPARWFSRCFIKSAIKTFAASLFVDSGTRTRFPFASLMSQ
ncbi:MAG: hypothetical protein NT142_09090 [Planctomycetota bacterium]|nr:hypothetical protein [Planctomycetota bacterium]